MAWKAPTVRAAMPRMPSRAGILGRWRFEKSRSLGSATDRLIGGVTPVNSNTACAATGPAGTLGVLNRFGEAGSRQPLPYGRGSVNVRHSKQSRDRKGAERLSTRTLNPQR